MESTLQNPVLIPSRTTSRFKTIVFWLATISVAMPIGSGGVVQMMQYFAHPHDIVPILGYPMYFFAILGFWKFFGALTILVPRFPRLKEWAYAGIFFDLTGAAATCAMSGDYGAHYFHVIAPLMITGFMLASWILRPPSRTLGMIFPAKSTAA